jgi:hypothetical protein
MRATCFTHLVLPDSMNRMIFGEEWKIMGQFYVQLYPVASSLLCPSIFLSTLFSESLNV